MKVKDGNCVYEFMGILNSWIVNRQYYTYKVKSSEQIHFEKFSKNNFGSDVMEVFTSTGIPFGHLSANTASYLKPLIESGVIYADGSTIASTEKDESVIAALYVKLIKGSSFLKRKRKRNAESILHNHILDGYINKERYSYDTIKRLGDYYYPVMRSKHIYPETHLLYNLMTSKAYFDKKIIPIFRKLKRKREQPEINSLGKACKQQSVIPHILS